MLVGDRLDYCIQIKLLLMCPCKDIQWATEIQPKLPLIQKWKDMDQPIMERGT